jgi:hypothetical protein
VPESLTVEHGEGMMRQGGRDENCGSRAKSKTLQNRAFHFLYLLDRPLFVRRLTLFGLTYIVCRDPV